MIKPKCPRCKIDLERNKKNSAFFYQCPSCYGSSFTVASLKKIISRDTVRSIWIKSKSQKNQGTNACPLCFNPMNTVIAPKDEHIELDTCHSCYNIWFDTNELKNFKPVEYRSKSIESQFVENRKKVLINTVENIPYELDNDKPPHITAYLSIIGLPAEKHQIKLKAFPIVTWALIAACLFISIYAFRHEQFMSVMAFHPAKESLAWIISSFTYFFVHADVGHLLGNLYFLWLFGDNTEDDLGSTNYIFLLLIATFLSAVLLPMVTGREQALIGASGGISGVVGYYLARFPKREFYVFFFFMFFTIPAWVFGGLYILKEVYGVFQQLNLQTNVSHISHMAGVIVGVLFATLGRRV